MNDRQLSARWAHDLLKRPFCLLDSESTGVSPIDQIVQIGVLFSDGSTLLDDLVFPTIPISPEASNIHGIRSGLVQEAPPFNELLPWLLQAIGSLEIVIYHSAYDLQLICQSLLAHGIYLDFPFTDDPKVRTWISGKPVHCAMLHYAQFIGDLTTAGNYYKWQKLPGGDHSAIGDCRATLDLIKEMASAYTPE